MLLTNPALRCNALVFDHHPGGGQYTVAHTIRFQVSGQILRGQGFGAADHGSGTVIQYVGKAGGVVVSFLEWRSERE